MKQRFKSKPRHVEAVQWDGTEEVTAEIVEMTGRSRMLLVEEGGWVVRDEKDGSLHLMTDEQFKDLFELDEDDLLDPPPTFEGVRTEPVQRKPIFPSSGGIPEQIPDF